MRNNPQSRSYCLIRSVKVMKKVTYNEVRCSRSWLREELREISQDLVRLFNFKFKMVKLVKFATFVKFVILIKLA